MQLLSRCEHCGEKIEQPKLGRKRRFCNDECRRAWWRNHPEESNPTDKAIYCITCIYCGEKFNSYGNLKRKYCCHEHYIAARFNQQVEKEEKATITSNVTLTNFKIREKANLSEIANISATHPSTLEQDQLPALSIKGLSDVKTVLLNPNELIASDMPDNMCVHRVYIFSSTPKFKGKFDYFASLIPQNLEMDLMNGDAFVFCNRSKSQISIIIWQGDGFALYFKRSDYGRFPWPYSTTAQVIEITTEDLKMLIEYPRFCLRLSGVSI